MLIASPEDTLSQTSALVNLIGGLWYGRFGFDTTPFSVSIAVAAHNYKSKNRRQWNEQSRCSRKDS